MSSSSDGRHLDGFDPDNPKRLKGSHSSAEPITKWKCKYCPCEIPLLCADAKFPFCPYCCKRQPAGEDLPLDKNPAEEPGNDLKNRNSIDKVEVINDSVPKSRLSQDEARRTESDSDDGKKQIDHGTRTKLIREEILPPQKKLVHDEQNSNQHISSYVVSEISNSTSTTDSLTASDSSPLVPRGPSCEPPNVPCGSATSSIPPSSDVLNAHRADQVSSNSSPLMPTGSNCEPPDVPGGSAASSILPSSDAHNVPLADPPSSDAHDVPLADPPSSDAHKVPLADPPSSDAHKVPLADPPSSDAHNVPLAGPPSSDAHNVPLAGPPSSDAHNRYL